jgi:transposase
MEVSMASIAEVEAGALFGGIDTHKDTVHVAVVDQLGRHLGDREFATTGAGYASALAWLNGHGDIARAGVEGTGSYGAGITAAFTRAGVPVVEVDRPDRAARRRLGKSDPIDAYAAARAAASGRSTAVPKDHTGVVESIRVLHLVRASAVKARTVAYNELDALVVTAAAELRESLAGVSGQARARVCARLRPGPDLSDPATATKTALRRLAQRIGLLDTEAADALKQLDELTTKIAPALLAMPGVGPETAATLLVAIGANPQRVGSEAALAMLFGVAPLPASSGRTTRHRLNRGGDRQANRALHVIALTRLRIDPRTRAYRDRKLAQSHTKKDVMRCLKRYITRELYPILRATLTT